MKRLFSREARAGAATVAPMLVGIIPFGLIAGATPVTDGLGGASAVGLSTIVFAGASQLAAADVLAEGGSAVVAVLAACTINLRLLLYSASIAPYLAEEPLRRRLAAAYLLTDQAYAVSITRWSPDTDAVDPDAADTDAAGTDAAGTDAAGTDAAGTDAGRRFPFYLGAGLLLWSVWQVSTIVGVLVGAAVPADVPLDFAVPLVFLVLLVPALTARPALIAAVVGGGGAVAAAEAGSGPLYVIVGALSGIAAGALAEVLDERGRP
jgi:predicted branched-subunit amino acid permease